MSYLKNRKEQEIITSSEFDKEDDDDDERPLQVGGLLERVQNGCRLVRQLIHAFLLTQTVLLNLFCLKLVASSMDGFGSPVERTGFGTERIGSDNGSGFGWKQPDWLKERNGYG